jgi:hypothetical protein
MYSEPARIDTTRHFPIRAFLLEHRPGTPAARVARIQAFSEIAFRRHKQVHLLFSSVRAVQPLRFSILLGVRLTPSPDEPKVRGQPKARAKTDCAKSVR